MKPNANSVIKGSQELASSFWKCLLAMAASCAVIHSASAEVLFNESFDYDISESDSLQNRTGGFGFTTGWLIPSGNAYIQLTSTQLSYQVAGGGAIVGGQTSVYAAFPYFWDNIATRGIDAFSGDEVYFRYLFQVPVGSSIVAGEEAGVSLLGAAGENYNLTYYGDRLTATAGSIYQKSPDFVPVNAELGETYLFVGRISKSVSGGDYDRVDYWVNPTATDMLTPDGTYSVTPSGLTTDAFSQIGLFYNLIETGTVAVNIGAIAGGTAWEDVVAVPEPHVGALLLMGLGGLAMVRFLRQRRLS